MVKSEFLKKSILHLGNESVEVKEEVPEEPLELQDLLGIHNQDSLRENHIRTEMFKETEDYQSDLNMALEAFDGVLKALSHVEECNDTSDPNLNDLKAGLLNLDKSFLVLKTVSSNLFSDVQLGMESIEHTPLTVITYANESIGETLKKIVDSVVSFLSWFLSKIINWIKYSYQLLNTHKKDALELKKKLSEFLNFNPDVHKISPEESYNFSLWINRSFPGITSISSSIFGNSEGIRGVGNNLIRLLERKQNFSYPNEHEISFQSPEEFNKSLFNYFASANLNSMLNIEDTTEFKQTVLEYHKIKDNPNDVLVKIIAVDFRSVHYLIFNKAEGTRTGDVKIERTSFRKLGKFNRNLIYQVRSEDVNELFNRDPVRWIEEACNYVVREVNKNLNELNKIAGRIKAARDNVKKAYRNVENTQNKELISLTSTYCKLIQRLVGKYQKATVNGNIQAYRDLRVLANRTYGYLVMSK